MSAPSASDVLKAQIILEQAKLAKASKPSKTAIQEAPEPALVRDQSNKENVPLLSDKDDDIRWAKHPEYTDQLLTVIEASQRYRRAFGFSHNPDAPAGTSGGQTTIKLCREIGQELFPESRRTEAKLGLAVKSRIASIKKEYNKYRDQLKETGHGLIVEGREDEIRVGTAIYNVYDKINKKFKWYKRLHLLLTSSPVYDSSAVANSTTPLDTSILGTASVPVTISAAPCTEPTAPAAGDVSGNDRSDSDSDESRSASPQPPHDSSQPPPSTPLAPPPLRLTQSLEDASVAIPLKRKGGSVDALAVLVEGKRQRRELKEEGLFRREQLRLEAEERQRQHELAMLDKKLELAKLKAQSF
ncbi:hypothetical protein H1R20_g15796, partial [Candolleomyces eurysporus]